MVTGRNWIEWSLMGEPLQPCNGKANTLTTSLLRHSTITTIYSGYILWWKIFIFQQQTNFYSLLLHQHHSHTSFACSQPHPYYGIFVLWAHSWMKKVKNKPHETYLLYGIWLFKHSWFKCNYSPVRVIML